MQWMPGFFRTFLRKAGVFVCFWKSTGGMLRELKETKEKEISNETSDGVVYGI